ncbi:MAG TPA: PLP-dependent aminotransferase family protein [Dermatophilaceae bacterium]
MVISSVSASRLSVLLGPAASGSPAYLAIADALRLLIVDGRIQFGTRLPSERDLTLALGLSRTTVTHAYAELRDRGYLTSRRGSGSVATMPGDTSHRLAGPLTPGESGDGKLDLTVAALPAPAGTAAAFASAMEDLPGYLTGSGYHPLGLEVLRTAVAARFHERGVPTEPEQIIITSGALSSLALVASTFLRPGDRAVMDSPTYPNTVAALRRSGARVIGVGVEPTGWDVEALESALRQVRPVISVLIPDFHNPTGSLMPDEERARVARAWSRSGTTGVVDETLIDFPADHTTGLPLPMAAHDPRTITVGSASKSFWGGLRIGWIRAEPDQMAQLSESRLALDLSAPVLEQLVLLHLMRERERIVEDQRRRVREARTTLSDELQRALPDWVVHPPAGGLSVWCELPDPLATALVAAAEKQDLLLGAGPRFAVDGGLERFLRLTCTQHPDTMRDAVARMAVAWEDAQVNRTARSRRSHLVA